MTVGYGGDLTPLYQMFLNPVLNYWKCIQLK